QRTTVNVLARVGEEDAGESVTTLVVLAHHDAPQTGLVFDQTLLRRLYERSPALIERIKSSPPQWWIGLGAPLLTLATASTRRRGFARAGVLIGALGTAAAADVWRSPTVAGANDNLSGVAALVALAEMLRAQPLPQLRVLLVSCGAEETLQDGVIPSRAGYPIATLVSTTDWGPPANYHLPSDIPANLDYDTVAAATRLVYELARAQTRHGSSSEG